MLYLFVWFALFPLHCLALRFALLCFALFALLRVALLSNSSKMNKSSILGKPQPAFSRQKLAAAGSNLSLLRLGVDEWDW